MEKIIAKKEESNIILVLDDKKVIEEYEDGIRARDRFFRRKAELKKKKWEIIHEVLPEPRKPKARIEKIMGRPLRVENED